MSRREIAAAALAGALAGATITALEQVLLAAWRGDVLFAHPDAWLASLWLALGIGTLLAVPTSLALAPVRSWFERAGRTGRARWVAALAAAALVAATFYLAVARPSLSRPSLAKQLVYLAAGGMLGVAAVAIGAAALWRRRTLAWGIVATAVLVACVVNLRVYPHLLARHHMFVVTLAVAWLSLAFQAELAPPSGPRTLVVPIAILAVLAPLHGLSVRDPYARFLVYRTTGFAKITGNLVDVAVARLRPPRQPKVRPDPALAAVPAPSERLGERPRWVVVLLADTLRADRLLGDDSNALRRLADRGLVFTRAYTQWGCTELSLASILRGDHGTRWDAAARRLSGRLREAGVQRVMAASAPFLRRLYRFAGFETIGGERSDDDAVLAASLAHLGAHAGEGGLLWVHVLGVHDGPGRLAPSPAAYDARYAAVSAKLARFVADIEALLGAERVTYVLLSDHGEAFGEHGVVFHCNSAYEDITHVPLAIWGAGLAGSGRVDTPVEATDVVPTLLHLFDAGACEGCTGRSLLAPPVADRCALSQATIVRGEIVALTCARWKIIADVHFGFHELYDLAADPRERRNVVRREPAALEDLRARLRQRTGL